MANRDPFDENELSDTSEKDDNDTEKLDGEFDPKDFIECNSKIDMNTREIFAYIGRYKPQIVDLDAIMKPFLPDYTPAMPKPNLGLNIPRPDGVDDGIGFKFLAGEFLDSVDVESEDVIESAAVEEGNKLALEESTETNNEPPVEEEQPSSKQPEEGASNGETKANADKALLQKALQRGSKPYKRSKLSLLGQGRAGKTALANSLTGKDFEDTASTVGINQLTCEVKHFTAKADGSEEEHEWTECEKTGREYEAAVAALMAQQRTAAQAQGKDVGAAAAVDNVKGDDIRNYLQNNPKPTIPTESDEIQDSVAVEINTEVVPTESQGDKSHETPTAPAQASVKTDTVASGSLLSAPSARYGGPLSSLNGRPTLNALTAPRVRKGGALRDSGNVNAPIAPIKAAKPSAQSPIDEDTVMKELAKLQDKSTGLLISLFDFGGQAVFDVIHHLFLTRNGVYALMFNMEWLVSDGPDKVTALSFMRKWLSSIAAHTLQEGRTAPIVIVGTRLDTISDPAVHERISTILYDELHDSLAWPSVIKNDRGHDRNGRAEQVFFPVNNKLGKKGPSLKHVMSVVHDAMDKAEYTHKEVPLTWFKAIDQMSDTKKDCLPLSEVMSTAEVCGVSEAEVPLLLSFLHDMGHLMWLDEPGLRDVVILDPVSYLVTPATIIICKLAPDSVDSVYHHMEVHAECQVKHRWEFDELVNRAVLSVKLLPILWKQYQQHSATLLQLMVKFGLLVALRSATADAPSQYLVPTLLSPAPLADPELVNWTDKRTSQCYFVFTLVEPLGHSATLTGADLVKTGFLPGGMFERIVGKVLSWSQDTAVGSAISIDSVVLHKDLAILSFGRQRFRLLHCADIHCVRVDVEGSNPVGIQQKLLDFIRCIVQECMGSLFCFPAVLFETDVSAGPPTEISKQLKPSEMLIPLAKMRAAVKGGSMLTRRGGRPLMTVEEVKAKYGQWLQLHELRERYDVFISYRWGQHDSKFTEQLFDMFTNYSVGAQSRAVEVFLDRKRLQEGRMFKNDFAAALTHSLIAVPVVSVDALRRMVEHDAAQTDNVLLEWIILLESFQAGRVLKVFPVLFGTRVTAEVGEGDGFVVKDFFSEQIKDALPAIAPTATLAQAVQLLQANGIQPSEKMQSYTVHSIVKEMLEFLLCKASDHTPVRLVQAFAEKVLQLLADCGSAVDEVVAPPTIAAAPTTAPTPNVPDVAASAPAAPAGAAKPLKEVTLEEVGQLLVRCGLEDLVPVFVANKVTGRRLLGCDEYSDLLDKKIGIESKVEAKELMTWIEDWKEKGVVL